MSDIRIVVLHRGWVVIGHYSLSGEEVTVSNASVIRRWGTSRGLGQIAREGFTSETILDPCGTVRAHQLAVVMTIDVTAAVTLPE